VNNNELRRKPETPLRRGFFIVPEKLDWDLPSGWMVVGWPMDGK
jgi:hypothetical protein